MEAALRGEVTAVHRSCRWRGPAVRGGCAGSRRHSSVGSIKRYISSISVGLVTRGGAPCRNIHLKLKMHVVMQSAVACILKLQEDVLTSGYQDVQFMFDMLTSQLESAHACKQPPSPDHGC
jgi:hypothetical protein